MFPYSWIKGEALTVGRYFRIAVWAEIGGLLACLFLLYCWYSINLGQTTPLQYVPVKAFLSLVGASGAFGSIFLSEGMWEYWKNQDNSPERRKRTWYWIMKLLNIFGCAAYYFLVYRPQIDSKES